MRALSPPLWLLAVAALLGGAALLAAWAAAKRGSTDADQNSFVAANKVAMSRMMDRMDIVPSGSADRDFAMMMIAHHEGAIEMARAELGYGHDEPLRRIAQGIIVEQQQEIEAMRLALGRAAPTSLGAICRGRP